MSPFSTMNAPTTTNYNFLYDGIIPLMTLQVYITPPSTSSPNITVIQPPSPAAKHVFPSQTTNQTTSPSATTTSAQQPTSTNQTLSPSQIMISSTQTTLTTLYPPIHPPISLPVPHSTQMTTRARHEIVKPHKLLNLHTPAHQSIFHLPTNMINTLNDHN